MTFTSKAVKYWPSNCHTSLVHCSVAQLCPTFHDSMDYSMPVHYHLPECLSSCLFISDAIQPSHPLMPSSSALKLSQHQGLFQWAGCLHQVIKILELQLQHQFFQWVFEVFPLRLTGLISLLSKGLSESSPAPQVGDINSSVLYLLYSAALTTVHGH